MSEAGRSSIGVRIRPNAHDFIRDLRAQLSSKRYTFYVNVGAQTGQATGDVRQWAKTTLPQINAKVPVSASLVKANADIIQWRSKVRKTTVAVPITADLSQANREVELWRRAAGRDMEIRVKANVVGRGSVDSVRRSLERDAKVQVKVDNSQVRQEVKEALDQPGLFTIEVDAKTKKAKAKVTEFFDEVRGEQLEMDLGVQTKPAEAEVKEFKKKAAADPITAELRLRKLKAQAELAELRLKERAKKIEIDVEVKAGAADRFTKNLRDIEERVGNFTVLRSIDAGPVTLGKPTGLIGTLVTATALAGLLPGVVTGIAALSDALVRLAGAAALVPGAIGGIAASFATFSIGTQGFGTAVSALFDMWNEGSDKMQTQAKKTVTAQNNLRRAVVDEARAQREVGNARREATRELRDLNNELRGSVLNEAQAILDLQKARDRIAQGGFDNQTDFLQAKLDEAKAEQSLIDVREKNVRLQEDANEKSAKGVEGSDQVTQAMENQARATEAVAAAMEAVNDAQSQGATSVFNDALAQLSPNAREAIEAIAGLKGGIFDFKNELQDTIFQGVGPAITAGFNNLMPVIGPGMTAIAQGLNQNILAVFDSLQSADGQSIIERILGGTAEAQKALTKVIDPLVRGIGTLVAAGAEHLPQVVDLIGRLADRFANFIEAADRNGNLDKFLDDGIKALSDIAELGINAIQIINDFSNAFRGAFGDDLLSSMVKITDRWHEFLSSAEGQQRLNGYISDARDIFNDWKPVLEKLPELFDAAQDGAMIFLNNITPLLEAMAWTLEKMPWLIEAVALVWLGGKMLSAVGTAVKLAQAIWGVAGALQSAIGFAGGLATQLGLIPTSLIDKFAGPNGPFRIAGALGGVGAAWGSLDTINGNNNDWLGILGGAGGGALAGASVAGAPGAVVGGTIGLLAGILTAVKQGNQDTTEIVRLTRIQMDADKIKYPGQNVNAQNLLPALLNGQMPVNPDVTSSDVSNAPVPDIFKNPLTAAGFADGGYTDWGRQEGRVAVVHGKEFVQPADSVGYYGRGVMEAMRSRSIPKEFFAGFDDGGPIDPNDPRAVQHLPTQTNASQPNPDGSPGIIDTVIGGATGIASNFITQGANLAQQAVGAVQGAQGGGTGGFNPLGGPTGALPGPALPAPGIDAGIPPVAPGTGPGLSTNIFGFNVPLGNTPAGWPGGQAPVGLGGGPDGFDIRKFGIGPGPVGSTPSDWVSWTANFAGETLTKFGTALTRGALDIFGLGGIMDSPYVQAATGLAGHFAGASGSGSSGVQGPGAAQTNMDVNSLLNTYAQMGMNPAYPGVPGMPNVIGPNGSALPPNTGSLPPNWWGTSGRTGSEAGLQINTIKVKRAIENNFPAIQSIGGWRTDALKWHPNGLAVDVMIPGGDTHNGANPTGKALGDQIYAWLNANKDQFGIDYILWQTDQGGNHFNHLHVNTVGGGYPPGGGMPSGANAPTGGPRPSESPSPSAAAAAANDINAPLNPATSAKVMEDAWKAASPEARAKGVASGNFTPDGKYIGKYAPKGGPAPAAPSAPAPAAKPQLPFLGPAAPGGQPKPPSGGPGSTIAPWLYDQGGILPPGHHMVSNLSGRNELVLPHSVLSRGGSYAVGGLTQGVVIPTPPPGPKPAPNPIIQAQPKIVQAQPKISQPSQQAQAPSVSQVPTPVAQPPGAPGTSGGAAPGAPVQAGPSGSAVTTQPSKEIQGSGPGTDKYNHLHPALQKGIRSGAAALGQAASTAISIAASLGAAGAAGVPGASGIGALGGLGSYAAGLIQQGGKIAENVANVGASFLVGNITGGTTQNAYGVTQRGNVPTGGTKIYDGSTQIGSIQTSDLDEYYRRENRRQAQRAQSGLGQWGSR